MEHGLSALGDLASLRIQNLGRRLTWLPAAAVALLSVASLLLMLWVHGLWRDSFRMVVPAIDNLAQARVSATDAMVLAEKLAAGDRTVQSSDVSAAFDRAQLAVRDCRDGASRIAGVPGRKLNNPSFADGLAAFSGALAAVRTATEFRMSAAGRLDPGAEIGQRQALHDLRLRLASLELEVTRDLHDRLLRQNRLLTALAALWAAFTVGLVAIVFANLERRQRFERTLAEAHSLLETMVAAAPIAVLVLDTERRIQLWNTAAERMFGWTRAEAIGSRLPIVPAALEPEHAALFRRVLGGEYVDGIELHRQRKDGTTVEVSLHSAPLFDAAGHVRGTVSALTDITERKRQEERTRQSEERYRQVVENAPVGIFIQLSRKFHYLNPAALRLFGAASAAELIGTPVLDRFSPEHHAAISARLQALMDNDEPAPVREEPVLRLDGTALPVQVSAVPFALGAEKGAMVFFGDVSEIRKAQEERRKLEEQFLQAQKMESIGRLAGGVAHDFNNHLTVINGYCDLILSELAASDPRHTQLTEVRKAGERAASLTQQLLAFSRRQVTAPAVIRLNDVIADTEKMLRRLIGEDIELITRLEPNLGAVLADSGQIHQVLLNLAVNSRDAMPGGGRIIIETANAEIDEAYAATHPGMKPGPHVLLAFSDTGTGMTEEVRRQVFEPFFTTKGTGLGTGLGLSTVYGIVRQSDGTISLYSEPGQGTTFKILLPAVKNAVVPEARPCATAAPPGGSETILVVEDNEDVRKLTTEILRELGYHILEAADGPTALSTATQYSERIHLLLTDVVMPAMTGKELAARLTALRPDLRTLFVSGYTADVIAHQGILDSGVNFLPKPFTPGALARKARSVLDNRI